MAKSGQPADEPAVARVAGSIEDGVRAAAGAAARLWHERPGARVRRVRRLGRNPLLYLYDLHPDALHANPRELGVHTIPVAEIAGTAVGPANQRGMDFLPLKPFRSANWIERWKRVRASIEALAVLPPIEVGRYAGRYWVFDGHNRVAAALYVGHPEIDADVKELVPPTGAKSGPAASLAAILEERAQLQSSLTRRSLGDEPPGDRGGAGDGDGADGAGAEPASQPPGPPDEPPGVGRSEGP